SLLRGQRHRGGGRDLGALPRFARGPATTAPRRSLRREHQQRPGAWTPSATRAGLRPRRMDLRGRDSVLQAGPRLLAPRRVAPGPYVLTVLVSRLGLRGLRPGSGAAPGADLRLRLPAPRAVRTRARHGARLGRAGGPAARRAPNPVEWS